MAEVKVTRIKDSGDGEVHVLIVCDFTYYNDIFNSLKKR